MMKTENLVAIDNLARLREKVKDSEKTADESQEDIQKDAEGRKLKICERLELSELSGTATEACWTAHLIEQMIVELASE